MLAKTRRRRVIHPFIWILGLIAVIALVLVVALPAYGCDPYDQACQLEPPEALADIGRAWILWTGITALAALAVGLLVFVVVRRPR